MHVLLSCSRTRHVVSHILWQQSQHLSQSCITASPLQPALRGRMTSPGCLNCQLLAPQQTVSQKPGVLDISKRRAPRQSTRWGMLHTMYGTKTEPGIMILSPKRHSLGNAVMSAQSAQCNFTTNKPQAHLNTQSDGMATLLIQRWRETISRHTWASVPK